MRAIRFAAWVLGISFLLAPWAPRLTLAGDAAYVETRGYRELLAARARLDREGSALDPALRDRLQGAVKALVDAEVADRDGTTVLQAQVKGDQAEDRALHAEQAALQQRADALRGNASRTQADVDDLNQAIAALNKKILAHTRSAGLLNERVRMSNRIREGRIAQVTRAILDALAGRPPTGDATHVTRDQLTDGAASLVEDADDYAPYPDAKGNLQTQCSAFVRDLAATVFGYSGFEGLNANQIFDVMVNDLDGWSAVQDPIKNAGDREAARMQQNLRLAQDLANLGYLVVAAWQDTSKSKDPHGHTAVVVPGTVEGSDKWGVSVPMIAQAGNRHDDWATGPKGAVWSGSGLNYGFGPDKKDKVVIYVRKPGTGAAAGTGGGDPAPQTPK